MATKRLQETKRDEFTNDPFELSDASGETEEDLPAIPESSLSSAVVWGTDWTAATLVDQLRRRTIALDPAFQRRDAWTDERKSRFIESLILGLPIPQLVLAEDAKRKGRFIVIDGKQRLLSLAKFSGVGLAAGQEPLELRGLTIRKELNKSTYAGLTRDPRFEDILTAFENQPIRTVVIRGWKTEQLLYTIFHRLNTGSVPLSPQELRQALHPGPFLDFAVKYSESSSVLQSLLGLSRPDFRMRDVELLVRFYAYHLRLSAYRGNLKKFIDDTCDILNRSWKTREQQVRRAAEDFDRAIAAAIKIFQLKHVFRKWDGSKFENRFNRAVFDVVAHSLTNSPLRTAALDKKIPVVIAFKNLCTDDDFRSSIESTTKSKQAVYTRFNKWYSTLASVTGVKLKIDLPNVR